MLPVGTEAGPEVGPDTAPDSGPDINVEPLPDLPTDPDARLISLLIGVPHGTQPINDVSVTVDGRVFLPVESPAGFAPPVGPAPQPFVVRQLTDLGLETLVNQAASFEFFAPSIDFGDAGITDQGHTSVTLATADGDFAHRAYALDFAADDPALEPLRANLRSFVDALQSLRSLDDPQLIGPAEPFVPDAWSVALTENEYADFDRVWPLDTSAIGPCRQLDLAIFDTDPSGQYVVAGTVVDERGTVVSVIPAFPWTVC